MRSASWAALASSGFRQRPPAHCLPSGQVALLSTTPSQSSSNRLHSSARGVPGTQSLDVHELAARRHQPSPQAALAPSSVRPSQLSSRALHISLAIGLIIRSPSSQSSREGANPLLVHPTLAWPWLSPKPSPSLSG